MESGELGNPRFQQLIEQLIAEHAARKEESDVDKNTKKPCKTRENWKTMQNLYKFGYIWSFLP